MSTIKLINGLPTAVNAYDESIYYDSGLAADTNITLPSSGSFLNATAKDILVIANKQVQEVTRDFDVVGSSPYTQIKFTRDLPVDTVVRFIQNI